MEVGFFLGVLLLILHNYNLSLPRAPMVLLLLHAREQKSSSSEAATGLQGFPGTSGDYEFRDEPNSGLTSFTCYSGSSRTSFQKAHAVCY